jgi:hypothetical protein
VRNFEFLQTNVRLKLILSPSKNESNSNNKDIIIIKVNLSLTGCGSLCRCKWLRLRHFMDNRLTDDGQDVSLTRRPPFTPRRIPGTHFC